MEFPNECNPEFHQFAFLRSVIDLENSRHPLDKSDEI